MDYHIRKLADVNPRLCQTLKQYCYELNGCCQTVHREMGPFLNEYMYQDALEIALKEKDVPYVREYYFSVDFHGQKVRHKHFVDFLVQSKILVECKAVECLGTEHRQQLWNYMRLTKVRIGVLYNFAPIRDQSEHYYYDPESQAMFCF